MAGVCVPPRQAHRQKAEKIMHTQTADVEVLDPETSGAQTKSASAAPSPSSTGPRCLHRFSNGKRCRRPGLESQSGPCAYHFHLKAAAIPPSPSDSADLSEDLLRGHTHFSSAQDLREFLTRLLTLMTKGRVSPRRAAVPAYITNQLLHSHRVVLKEEELDNKSQPIIFDLPRPNRD